MPLGDQVIDLVDIEGDLLGFGIFLLGQEFADQGRGLGDVIGVRVDVTRSTEHV